MPRQQLNISWDCHDFVYAIQLLHPNLSFWFDNQVTFKLERLKRAENRSVNQ